MKQLKVFTGGHPRNIDDLVHIQSGAKESLIALAKGLLSNGAPIQNCILYGFVPTPAGFGNTTYSAGACILDGEICIFSTQTIMPLVAPYYYVIRPSDTYPATNPVIYADATSHNVHLDRVAVIAPTSAPLAANEIILSSAPIFLEILRNNLNPISNWRKIGETGNPPAPTYSWYGSGSEILFRKNEFDNSVEIRGRIIITDTAVISAPPVNYNLFNLPNGYIPAYDVSFFAPIKLHLVDYEIGYNNDSVTGLNLFINNLGNVSINPIQTPADNDYSITFYTKFALN